MRPAFNQIRGMRTRANCARSRARASPLPMARGRNRSWVWSRDGVGKGLIKTAGQKRRMEEEQCAGAAKRCAEVGWRLRVAWRRDGQPGIAALAHQNAIGSGHHLHQSRLPQARRNDDGKGRALSRSRGDGAKASHENGQHGADRKSVDPARWLGPAGCSRHRW